MLNALRKVIPELETLQVEELLQQLEEVSNKVETGLLKQLAKRNKFEGYHLPIFSFGNEESLQPNAQPGAPQSPTNP